MSDFSDKSSQFRKTGKVVVGGISYVPDKRVEIGKNASTEILRFRKEVGAKLGVLAKRIGSRHDAAQVAGVARSTLQLWLVGESDPSFIGVARLCRAADISLEWLLEGVALPSSKDAPVRFAGTKTPALMDPVLTDENLMGELMVGIADAYADAGKDISLGEMGRLAARMAADIGATTATVEERSAALKMALLNLRRNLSDETS